jgi:Glycosyltransferases involved in cell wall biogenesis
MAKIDEVSVFFPAFNEEKNIQKTIKRAVGVLEKIAEKWEIIVVNDGSTDKTGATADKLAKENRLIQVIHHPQNQGYGAALKSGFYNAHYPWVAFTDADGQFDFSEIKKFLPFTNRADLILGYRLKRADLAIRRLGTFVWFLVARIFLGLNVKDYSCGFKLIKKRVFEAVQPLEAEEKVTQIEFLVKAKRQGFRFVEVGVHHYPRKFGQQTGANIKVVFKSTIDIIKLWQKLR